MTNETVITEPGKLYLNVQLGAHWADLELSIGEDNRWQVDIREIDVTKRGEASKSLLTDPSLVVELPNVAGDNPEWRVSRLSAVYLAHPEDD